MSSTRDDCNTLTNDECLLTSSMFRVGSSTLADDVNLACDEFLFWLNHPRCAVVACTVCVGLSGCGCAAGCIQSPATVNGVSIRAAFNILLPSFCFFGKEGKNNKKVMIVWLCRWTKWKLAAWCIWNNEWEFWSEIKGGPKACLWFFLLPLLLAR